MNNIIQPYTTPYDPHNTTKQNYNPNQITKVNKPVFFNYVINNPIECGTCLVNFENPLKPCYHKCKFRARFQYNKNKNIKDISRSELYKYICVETRYSKKDLNSIYMRRWTLYLNYYMDLDFIFRTANSNGLHGHHINRKETNDLLENIAVLHFKNHKFNSNQIDHCDLFYKILDEVPKYIKKGKIFMLDQNLMRKYSPPKTYNRQPNRISPVSLV